MIIATARPIFRRSAPELTAPSWSTTALRAVWTLLRIAVSAILLLVVWDVAVNAVHANPLLAKRPVDVWRYLFVDDPAADVTAADNRHLVLSLLLVTLRHAALGFAVGVTGSVLISVLFALVRPVRYAAMPLVVVMTTVPLVATAPVIYRIFGTGSVTAALTGGIFVCVPFLVNMTHGFSSVNPLLADLITVNGGGRWTLLAKVGFPTALPYMFASIRMAVTAAMSAALIYEWLFTFEGFGAAIVAAKNQFDYTQVWAIGAIVTAVTLGLYGIASVIETIVLANWGPNAGSGTTR